MRTLAGLILTAGLAACQTLSLSAPTEARPGESINLAVRLDSPSAIAGVQWDLPNTTAAQSLVQGKTATCNTTGRCLLFGLDVNPIPNGDIARIPFQSATPGTFRFRLENVVAASPSGGRIELVAGPEVTVIVRHPFDLDGDGSLTSSDLSLAVSQVLNGACSTADVNKDSRCDIADILALVIALL